MEFKPFLKWAGGKTQLLRHLVPMTPEHVGTYFEPFIGGGALFFALAAGARDRSIRRATLNDFNRSLMVAYGAVKNDPIALIQLLRAYDDEYKRAGADARESIYYAVRKSRPAGAVGIAARMIFLNKTCYNGLYRENRKGEFNVPHGRYPSPTIVDPVAITQAARVLSFARLERGDFSSSVDAAEAGDFAYFDPPFHPLSKTSSFTSYTSKDFGTRDQRRLREVVENLHSRGVNVMVSNSPHPWIRELYCDSKFRFRDLPARRMINSHGDKRGEIAELVITNYDPPVTAPHTPSNSGASASAG